MRLVALIAIVFGGATVFSGGRVLFGDGAAQAGAYVPFVVWFNFLAGFAYVVAGAGIWQQQRWSAFLALGIAVATLGMFAAFALHIALGGAYEMRTLAAMTLRTVLWAVIAVLALGRFGARASATARAQPQTR